MDRFSDFPAPRRNPEDFQIGKIEADAVPGREIIRATSPDGRHLTVTVLRGSGYRVGQRVTLARVVQ